MGFIAIYCPRTGREVSTGVETDNGGFQRLRPVVVRMKCPACGSEHVWSKATARLVEPVVATTHVAKPAAPAPPPVRSRPAAPAKPAVPPPPAQPPAAKRGRTLSIANRLLDPQ